MRMEPWTNSPDVQELARQQVLPGATHRYKSNIQDEYKPVCTGTNLGRVWEAACCDAQLQLLDLRICSVESSISCRHNGRCCHRGLNGECLCNARARVRPRDNPRSEAQQHTVLWFPRQLQMHTGRGQANSMSKHAVRLSVRTIAET
jgi:hypothetical protein